MSLARALISGTVVSDPEKRFTPNNNVAVTNFTVQVNASGREAPFMVRVVCWRALAETVAENIRKGDNAVIEGRLQVNQYDSPGGAKRTYEIDATQVYKGELQPLAATAETPTGASRNQSQGFESRPADSRPGAQQPVAVGVATASQAPKETFSQEDLLTEDDIPF
jgi:single-strand DNA-binding protein